MLGTFGMPFTPTVGKEAFLRGPTYSVKIDLDALVSRKKEICFPDTVPVTHESADSTSGRGFMIRALSVLHQKHWYWSTTGNLRPCTRKRLFSLQTVHLPVSPLSTLWARPYRWAWIRARFCPMPWDSTLEAGLMRLFAVSFGLVGGTWLGEWRPAFGILCGYF
jgi:hypothetical protein